MQTPNNADTIADNAPSGSFMIGETKVDPKQVDLKQIRMQLFKNGHVLGDPAACVAWLANKLGEYNVSLKSGEVILSGALSSAIEIQKGDKISASFTHLGEIESKVE
ncbi:fumarylacetoacetate hydrolase family protein [Alteribacillus bidgolensis]|uniref:2-keto-4-pentenoate hydratase n=1 Tax=Alteribacillus bidgolensis TaxID=930129 RepID=A0A1G8Q0D3_9BACI|nr:hypothetical protein [Alteribacillus bidgolensis]SDI97966.1 2-keto-4-pentenoate hydratase [Alteribacillus bidgolensis]